MLLTVSKRVEFSASRRLFSPGLSAEGNARSFGPESNARYGTGRNYVVYFVFSGLPDPVTGMLINISEIKERAGAVIHEHYDHRFLNEDNVSFAETVPTAEAVARQLFSDVAPLFADEPAQLAAVHLRETPERSATAYASGAIEANYWFEFSAARQTMSSRLSVDENKELFRIATREHGHNYRARLTLDATAEMTEIDAVIRSLQAELDHKNLNRDVPALRDEPITTESLARFILRRGQLEIARVRLHERDDFFAEAWHDGGMFLGLRAAFSAVHRLHVPSYSEAQNSALFGKCNNPRGHGHRYVTETTIAGDYDERSGAVASLDQFRGAIDHELAPWRDKHLDLEVDEFRTQPSTGENIVRALWKKLDSALDARIARLRLWETGNNCFTLRRV